MNRLPRVFPLLACLLLFLGSCGDSSTESDYSGPGPVEDFTPTPIEDLPPPPPDASLDKDIHLLIDSVFRDFKVVKMDPLSAIPKLKSAKRSIYKRLRRRAPVHNKRGDKTFPRILLKAWEFESEKDLVKDVEEWLNSHESSQDSIRLGDKVEAFKSPPLLCAASKTSFFVVQYACMYEGENWAPVEEAFFELIKGKGPQHSWKVTCKAGEFEYR